MPTVRKFDTDHVFQFGLVDKENGHTRHSFYRNSTSFDIDIRKERIEGSACEQAWSNALTAHDRDPGDWVSRLEDIDDVVIAQILPTLKTLAPNERRQWTTVEDYLQTPSYQLEMVMDSATGDAVARVVDGPQAKPAYQMRTYPLSQFEVPSGLKSVDASDVVVLENGEEEVFQPIKAVDPTTGTHCCFERTRKPVMSAETKQVSNRSLDTIAQILRGDSTKEGGDKITPLALVTTTKGLPDAPEDSQDVLTVMVAGLLHT